jgi:hypothetical protein
MHAWRNNTTFDEEGRMWRVMGEGEIEDVNSPLICCVMETVTASLDAGGDEDCMGPDDEAED